VPPHVGGDGGEDTGAQGGAVIVDEDNVIGVKLGPERQLVLMAADNNAFDHVALDGTQHLVSRQAVLALGVHLDALGRLALQHGLLADGRVVDAAQPRHLLHLRQRRASVKAARRWRAGLE